MTSPDQVPIKRGRGRPRKYDNWMEFNYEYHKMMDNERKQQPDIRAKKSEYQREYRKRKKEEKMLATTSPIVPIQIAVKILWHRLNLLIKFLQAWKQCV